MSAEKTRMPAARANDAFNADESPIAWLRRRKDRNGESMLSQAQFDAGERLRADFWFAHMTPRTTMNWSAAAPQPRGRRYGAALRSSSDMQDNTVAAAERVRRALAAVGPELSGVLIDVCCHLKGLEEAERLAGWPQRSGKIVLQLALTSLARHYGLEPAGCGATGPGRMRHWGSEDYRPHLDVPTEAGT
jgi:uncharacterized protein DUF6456